MRSTKSKEASKAVGSVGINYGRIADNLPSVVKVVQLIKSQGLERVKVYDTDPAILRALSGTGIKVTVDLPNEFLPTADLEEADMDEY
ncbi:hypothetical protein Tsubulata_034095 [Turnera subulata]|uniref:glucan endo-1,3-beta-D-glucosidase n=1 Tax=Turnera subulata TaxID=218843 RepID=A0A9Q0GGM4_9ROSI|nr:hypothetical protein Tsubulata_034095 [Turnera subulata]